jgi:nitric oxide reductase large subunit
MMDAFQTNRSSAMEFLRLVRIVLSSFFGVRNRASHEADIANVNFVLLPFVAVFLAVAIGAIIFGFVHLVADSTSAMQGF